MRHRIIFAVFAIYIGSGSYGFADACKVDSDCRKGMKCCESKFVKEVIAKNPQGDFGNYCAYECISEEK